MMSGVAGVSRIMKGSRPASCLAEATASWTAWSTDVAKNNGGSPMPCKHPNQDVEQTNHYYQGHLDFV